MIVIVISLVVTNFRVMNILLSWSSFVIRSLTLLFFVVIAVNVYRRHSGKARPRKDGPLVRKSCTPIIPPLYTTYNMGAHTAETFTEGMCLRYMILQLHSEHGTLILPTGNQLDPVFPELLS